MARIHLQNLCLSFATLLCLAIPGLSQTESKVDQKLDSNTLLAEATSNWEDCRELLSESFVIEEFDGFNDPPTGKPKKLFYEDINHYLYLSGSRTKKAGFDYFAFRFGEHKGAWELTHGKWKKTTLPDNREIEAYAIPLLQLTELSIEEYLTQKAVENVSFHKRRIDDKDLIELSFDVNSKEAEKVVVLLDPSQMWTIYESKISLEEPSREFTYYLYTTDFLGFPVQEYSHFRSSQEVFGKDSILSFRSKRTYRQIEVGELETEIENMQSLLPAEDRIELREVEVDGSENVPVAPFWLFTTISIIAIVVVLGLLKYRK